MNVKVKCAVYIPAILLLVATGYPFLWLMGGTVSTVQQYGRISFIPIGFTFEHYLGLFYNHNFPLYISNTLIYAVIGMIISVKFNSFAAYALARLDFPGKNVIFIIILSTMMIPFSVVLIPLFLIIRSMGLTNSLAALILPGMASGFGIFLLRQFYLGIPTEMEDAAKIDGMSYLGIYFYIILPLSKPILMASAMFAFLGAWNSYLWPLVVNSREEYWVITTGIASFFTDRTIEWNMIFAGAAVSVIPTVILFALFQRQLIEGVKMSGIK